MADMGNTHSQGAFSKIILGTNSYPQTANTAHTFTSNDLAIEFLAADMKKRGRRIGGNGIRGTLARESIRTRNAAHYFSGQIQMYADPGTMDVLLTNVMGMSETTDVWTLNDTLPYFGVLVDTEADVFEYEYCMLDYWVLQGRAPQFGEDGEPDMVKLTLGIIGSKEDYPSWPGAPPSIGTTVSVNDPYVFQDACGSVDIGATSDVPIEEFALVVRNFVKPLYANCIEPYALRPRNRVIQLRMRVPWNSDTVGLYGSDALAGGVQVDLKLTNASETKVSTDFDFPLVHIPDNTPVIQGKDEISLILDGVAYADGANTKNEMTITNDATVEP